MKIDQIEEKWTKKYKKSIDCSNPKGFSQKAHCAGKKKKKKKGESVEEQIGTGRRLTVQPHMTGLENPYQKQNKRELKVFTQAYKDTYDQARAAQKKADATGGPGASYQVGLANPKSGFSSQVVPPRTTPKKPRPTLNPPLNNSIQELKIEKPDSVDTKGIKRVEMPQIHKDDYNEFIDYLKDNGAEFTKQTMPAQQLKASQGEFSDKGVMKQIDKQMRGEPRKPIIASQDNFIIDGHHRWLVAWNTKDSVDVFKVNMDADKLLKLVKKFPKTTYKDIYTEELYDFDKDEPMKSTVAVPGYGTMSVDGLMKNLVQSVTELLGRMKQGTDGMRFADYELNKNKVLTSKLSALIQALDDLQAIRKKGGARSRNIQKESFILEDGWFDYYKKVAGMVDPVRPYIRNVYRDQYGNPLDPNNKDHMKAIADQSPEELKQLSQDIGKYINTPASVIKTFVPQSTLDKYGITKDELPKIIALRDKFKKEHPEAFELIRTGQADKAWALMRNESIIEQEQEPLPIDTDKVFSYIQKLESDQNISPQDADLMRRGIQSLESARQTLNPQAILQLLTILT